jgi:hypothetical protein
MTLEHQIQQTVLAHKAGVEDLSAQIGRAASTLYAWANPNGEASPPLHMLLPLMTATNDYRILRWFAKRTRHVLVPLKRRISRVGPVSVLELQDTFSSCTRTLIARAKGQATRADCREAMYATIETLQAGIKALEAEGFLPLEETQLCLELKHGK